jgi:hypothetical protein
MYARISAFLVAFALAVTGLASAQETTGSLAGQVNDPQGLAVPGATVTVTGPQGARTFVTDAEGRWVAPFLTPGQYTVRIELQGFKASEQQNIQVQLASRREVNVRLETGGLTETVQVTGSAPVIDTRSTTIGGVLDSEQLSRLPVGRSLASTLYLVPGVSDSSGAGSATPSITGGSGLENSYIIDGVNITDVGFGGMGSYNSQYGSLGAGVTSDFIKETQVMTAGFEAEYGQASGGVVNVVTKSGSNVFSGSAFGYTRPGGLEAGWEQLTTPNGTVNTDATDTHDIGISVGGRIVPDRVFFFGTYNPQWNNRTFLAPNNTSPVFPYAALGGIERKRTIQAYAGKLTAQLQSNHRLDFSLFGDPASGSGLQRFSEVRRLAYPGAPGTSDISGGFSELDYGTHNQAARYDGVFGSRWLLEANLAHSSQKFSETPETDDYLFQDLRTLTGAACGLPAGQVCPQGRSGGLGFFEQNEGKNLQYGLKSTNILNGLGTHEIRYGVQVENIDFTRGTNYSGADMRLANGRTTVTGGPIQIRTGGGITYYRATRGLLLTPGPTTQDYTSFFIQDTWQAGRLTVRPGVRYERQYLEGQDPSAFPAPLCFDNDTRPGAGDGSGTGIACNFTWNNWAPRIGGTFDLTGDGRAKAYASWGHFYAKIPNDLAARAMSADTGITRQDFADPGLTQPVANGTVFGGVAGNTHLLLTSDHAAIIDPDAKSTYQSEFLAGVEFDVLGNANLGFRYIRRTMPQMLEDIGQLSILGYFVAPDTPVDYFITNVNADTVPVQCCGTTVAFEDPEHTYDAFEVTLNKRFSGNWSAIASYRFSKLEGNFEGFFRSDNGQSDPSITSLFDFPTNDPSYVATGANAGAANVHGGSGDIRYQGCSLGCGTLPNDRPHQLKLYGNYVWNAVNFGAGINAGSGRSLTAMASNPVYANAGEIPLTIRGEGMQTVDGFRERTPAEITVDLHVDYGFQFGGRRLLLLADAFNLFNRQEPTWYDYWYETTVGTLNPNFGQPVNGGGSSTTSFQAPFALRLGARFDW